MATKIVVYVSPPESSSGEPAYLAFYSPDGILQPDQLNLDGIVTSWIKIEK